MAKLADWRTVPIYGPQGAPIPVPAPDEQQKPSGQ
jgi:hypothetical protein